MKSGCSHCQELYKTIEIKQPEDLRSLIGWVQQLVTNKLLYLTDYFPKDRVTLSRDECFMDLPVEGPWPDLVEYFFVCRNCHQLFHLFADTYHGSGGAWQVWQHVGIDKG